LNRFFLYPGLTSIVKLQWSEKLLKEKLDNSEESGIIEPSRENTGAEKDLANQKTASIKRAIRKYEKRIAEHEDKINNPEDYYPDWDSFDERYQEGLKRHWRKEIRNFEQSIQNRKDELERRGESDEDDD
ncbi:MAG: hypothetical protein LUH45_05030, partial [Clostridiales bacterium]|nr:hypothetical protein [Clostridiales bacterium]